MDTKDRDHENIAQTLARELPKPERVHTVENEDHFRVFEYIAVPHGFRLEKIDNEELLTAPHRTKATASFADADSFIAYLQRYAKEQTTLWVKLDPRTSSLAFAAVIDEHAADQAAWRDHRATLVPSMSVEWDRWTKNNGPAKTFSQVEFALFLEDNLQDITSAEGMPTGAQMLDMALQFEARQDMRLKSHARLQNGGIQLEYVADDDKGTIEQMKLFERFAIGVPVFWNGPGYRIDARLRYRARDGKVTFWYELIRPDRIHEDAARAVIQKVREALPEVHLYLGAL